MDFRPGSGLRRSRGTSTCGKDSTKNSRRTTRVIVVKVKRRGTGKSHHVDDINDVRNFITLKKRNSL